MKETRINEKTILSFIKVITEQLTYAEYEILKTKLDRLYNQELKSSTYQLKVDTTHLDNLTDLNLL